MFLYWVVMSVCIFTTFHLAKTKYLLTLCTLFVPPAPEEVTRLPVSSWAELQTN